MTTVLREEQRSLHNSSLQRPAKQALPTGLWSVIRPVRARIRIVIALAAISAALELLSLICISVLITTLLTSPSDQARIWWLLGATGLTSILTFVVRIWAFYLSHRAAFRLEEHLRLRLAEHLGQVPLGYVTVLGSGTLKKIIQDDVRALHVFVADSTPMIGRVLAAPVLTLIVLFVLDWRLALASLAMLPIGLITFRFAMRDYAEKRRAYDQANEQINTAVIEFVQGMQVIRTFDDGTTSFQRYSRALDAFTRHLKDWMAATDVPDRLTRIVFASLPTLLVTTVVGTWLLIQGSLAFSTLLLFLFLATGVSEVFMPLMWLSQLLTLSRASAIRIGEVLAEPT
jgi:ATP-binding cassette, subfamily B, bacterial IrtA/YbtP